MRKNGVVVVGFTVAKDTQAQYSLEQFALNASVLEEIVMTVSLLMDVVISRNLGKNDQISEPFDNILYRKKEIRPDLIASLSNFHKFVIWGRLRIILEIYYAYYEIYDFLSIDSSFFKTVGSLFSSDNEPVSFYVLYLEI